LNIYEWKACLKWTWPVYSFLFVRIFNCESSPAYPHYFPIIFDHLAWATAGCTVPLVQKNPSLQEAEVSFLIHTKKLSKRYRAGLARYVEQIFDTNLNNTRQLGFYSKYEKSTLVFL